MCDFMGLRSFGPDALLRFTLRSKLRELRSDDKDILWEGVGTLTQDELDVALRARGLPYHGLNTSQKRDALQAPSLTRARAHPAPRPRPRLPRHTDGPPSPFARPRRSGCSSRRTRRSRARCCCSRTCSDTRASTTTRPRHPPLTPRPPATDVHGRGTPSATRRRTPTRHIAGALISRVQVDAGD